MTGRERETLLEELGKLENYQIREVARALDIGEESFSLENNKKRGELIGDLLDILDRQEISLNSIKEKIIKYNSQAFQDEKGVQNLTSPKPSNKSFEQELADLLLLLNYYNQQRQFKEVIQNFRGGAFLIKENNTIIQKWLFCHLATSIETFTKARKFPITIDKRIGKNLEYFYPELSNKFFNYNHNLDKEKFIEKLIDICEKQSVIICFQNLCSIKENKEILNELYGFCSELVSRFRHIPNLIYKDLQLVVLLLAENDTVFDLPLPYKNQEHINLDVLEEISQTHVADWVNFQQPVRTFLENIKGDKKRIIDLTQELSQEPYDLLNAICEELPITANKVGNRRTNITDVERYWKL